MRKLYHQSMMNAKMMPEYVSANCMIACRSMRTGRNIYREENGARFWCRRINKKNLLFIDDDHDHSLIVRR